MFLTKHRVENYNNVGQATVFAKEISQTNITVFILNHVRYVIRSRYTSRQLYAKLCNKEVEKKLTVRTSIFLVQSICNNVIYIRWKKLHNFKLHPLKTFLESLLSLVSRQFVESLLHFLCTSSYAFFSLPNNLFYNFSS